DGDSIIQYQWAIKDAGGNLIGAPFGATTSFSFPAAGTYTVMLTVTDSDGQTGGTSATVNVSSQRGGAIHVTTNLPAATFAITGPATYSGSGMTFIQTNAPAGVYMATFGSVAGYASPSPQTQTLAVGGTVVFTGTYIGPKISVVPTSIDFGSVKSGQTKL